VTRVYTVTHEFVEYIPDELAEGTVYVSIPCATVAHKCFCGCGNEVVTPLSPIDWRLIFDGDSISLEPSIGNWNFECRSHYWIVNNRVRWAESWSRTRIDEARERDRQARASYFSSSPGATSGSPAAGHLERKPWWRQLIPLRTSHRR
jgi:hypothetical protein